MIEVFNLEGMPVYKYRTGEEETVTLSELENKGLPCGIYFVKIKKAHGIRIIRDGVVVHTGLLDALKRFKDDAKEVAKGYDCGMQIKGFNDIIIGDVIEAFQEVEVKKKLK